MRKFILVAALVLASASAQAATRSLTLASADGPVAAPQTSTSVTPQAAEAATPADAPKYVDRPSAVSTTAPATTTVVPVTKQAPASAPQAKAHKPKQKRYWTEGRIISELHRHGIYW